MHLKMSSAKWRLFRLGLNVLNIEQAIGQWHHMFIIKNICNLAEIIEAIQQHMSPREILHNRIVTIQHLWQYLQSKGYSASKTKKDTLVNDVLKFWESPNKVGDQFHLSWASSIRRNKL